MIYSKEVDNMCVVAKGPNHGPAPIPEEGKWYILEKSKTSLATLTVLDGVLHNKVRANCHSISRTVSFRSVLLKRLDVQV